MIRAEIETLRNWYKKSHRKPLIIRGARQVGKSTLVKLFAKKIHVDFIEINLELKKLKSLKTDSSNPFKLLIQEIESLFDKKLGSKSLVFFDEIQQMPELIPLLRYFYEERPEIAVICAGSLLEFVLEDHNFLMPVGRVEFMYLGPMKFSEFLINGSGKELYEQIQTDYPQPKVFQQAQLTEQLNKYFYVGGMPEAIKVYNQTHSPAAVRDVHRSIILSYKNDFSKYTNKKDLPRIEEIFDALPKNLGHKVKYAQFSAHIDSRKIKQTLHLLNLAHLVHFCYHTNASGIPLVSQKDSNIFKLYFLDVGLLHFILDLNWSDLAQFSDRSLLTQGLSAEQFIAQHLAYREGALVPPSLYYWLRDKSNSRAEIDFIINLAHKIIPLEVKSGKSGKIKSLIQFMNEKKYSHAIRLDLKERDNKSEKVVEHLSLKNTTPEAKLVEFDLTNLHLGLIELVTQSQRKTRKREEDTF